MAGRSTAAAAAASAASASPTGTTSTWEDCRQQLAMIRQKITVPTTTNDNNNDNDPIRQALQHQQLVGRAQQFHDAAAQESAQAEAIFVQLQHQFDTASQARQQRQHELAHVQAQYQLVRAAVQGNADRQMALQAEIDGFRNEAATELATVSHVQQQGTWQVPRLQHQLSLYAACTGVKWNFVAQQQQRDAAHLVGEMVRCCCF
jgi:hypothetical protein